jgi:hypothetical protein
MSISSSVPAAVLELKDMTFPTSGTVCVLGEQMGRVARETVTTENVSAAFGLPVTVRHDDGRWSARAVRVRQASRGTGDP